jgi:YidC/Oxa1 family membrane protein insertase
MQQKMMKYMMIFMGVLFFKVASGLCLYFIASSLWSVGERKFLPKMQHHGDAQAATPRAQLTSADRNPARKKKGKR